MSRSYTILQGSEAVADTVVSTILAAFATDPLARWVYPNIDEYLREFRPFVHAFAGQGFRDKTAQYSSDFAAAALWLRPGAHPDDAGIAALLQKSLAAEQLEKVFVLLERMGSYHPEEPHYYLPMIGTEPFMQGKSYGSALLRKALASFDEKGTPAYLESSNPRNIPLYQRHGFEIIGEIRMEGVPLVTPMFRPVQQRSPAL